MPRHKQLLRYMFEQLPDNSVMHSHYLTALGIYAMCQQGLSDQEIIDEIDRYVATFTEKKEYTEAPF